MTLWGLLLLFTGANWYQNPAPVVGERQITTWYNEAQQAQAREDFDGAIAAYQKILAARPDLAEIHSNLGLVYYLKARYRDAAASFQRALERKPGLFGAVLLSGISYAKLHQYDKAVPLLRKAVEAQPEQPQALLYLGIALAGASEFEAASPGFERLIDLQPQDVEALYQTGSNYLRLFSKSLERMRSLEPDGFLIYRTLAELDLAQGIAPDLIEERYRKAIARNPSFPNLHWRLAELRIEGGNLKGAEEELRAELEIHPDHMLACLRLSEALKKAGKQDEAWALFERGRDIASRIPKSDDDFRLLMSKDPRAAVAFLDTVVTLAESEFKPPLEAGGVPHPRDLPRTLKLVWERLQAEPGATWYLEVYSRARMAEGNLRQLRDQLLSLRAGSGVTPMTHYLIAETYRRLALSVHQRMVASNPESGRAHQLLAEAFEAKHQDESAIREYHAAIAANPGVSGVYYRLGTLLAIRDEVEPAIEAFKKELEVDPHQVAAMIQLGNIYIYASKPREGLVYLSRALEEDSDNAEIPTAMGRAYRMSGEFEEAARMFEKSLKLQPGDASVHYMLGLVYRQLGRTEEANREMSIVSRLKQQGPKKEDRVPDVPRVAR